MATIITTPTPTVPLLDSKLRICRDMLQAYNLELLELQRQLKTYQLEQSLYDECVAAIERDKQHIRSEMEGLKAYHKAIAA